MQWFNFKLALDRASKRMGKVFDIVARLRRHSRSRTCSAEETESPAEPAIKSLQIARISTAL